MLDNKKYAFTLAETLIVVVVMGIIAMLTVPNVIKKYQEAQQRLKIKRSMTVYDLAITRMTVENDLRSEADLKAWADDDCSNTSKYFKVSKFDGSENKCQFKTSDGVWWNISDIMNPIIALSEQALIDAIANGTDGLKSFKLVTSFDGGIGSFRVDDIGFEKAKLEALLTLSENETKEEVQENVEELEKLFGFINDKKSKDNNNENINNGETINIKYCNENENTFICKLFREDTNIKNICPSGDLMACFGDSIDLNSSHYQNGPISIDFNPDCFEDSSFDSYSCESWIQFNEGTLSDGTTLSTTYYVCNGFLDNCSLLDATSIHNDHYYDADFGTYMQYTGVDCDEDGICQINSFYGDVTINGETYHVEGGEPNKFDFTNDNVIYYLCEKDMSNCQYCFDSSGNDISCPN